MKKLLGIICLVVLLISGCSADKFNNQDKKVTELNESVQLASKSLEQSKTITFDDQKQVEEVIRGYFSALEKKEYSTAWELTSSEQKKEYTKEDALKNHWGLESIKLVSMKGYLPSNGVVDAVPSNIPTIWFIATLDIQPTPDNAWNKGVSDRFVNVVKDSDGKWRIDGLATGP